MSTRWFALALALGLLGCRGGKAEALPMTATCSAPASDGRLEIRWSYKNRIWQWKGGAQTLDGPTRTLFGGGDIPHIWPRLALLVGTSFSSPGEAGSKS